jgi:sensor histidine kinase regulating citrate/malate metabolism
MMAGKSRQAGMSIFTVIFIMAVLGAVGAMVLQAFPSIVEYQAALRAINKAKDEATVGAVRAAFDRSAQVDDIKSITGKDLEISKVGDQVVVSFAYQKEFHMFGPAWLTLKYAGQSRPGR